MAQFAENIQLPLITTDRIAAPFLKWAGGKTALLGQLKAMLPANYSSIVEPFVGGGSFLFANSEGKRYLAYDANQWLVDTYKAVAKDWQQVADIIDSMPNTKSFYLTTRSIHPDSIESIYKKAASLIYLNKTCFRGLFRVNKKGYFNVPYGEYDRRIYNPRLLEACSACLSKVETIANADYRKSLAMVPSDAFVYLDPPYYKAGGYSDFNRYTASKFELSDQIELAAICNELSERGIKWMLSNSDTHVIRGLYQEYRITDLLARREINLTSSNRDITELLITNY